MRQILFIVAFTCAYAFACAQVNYVKNPSFEDTVKCPDEINEIGRAKNWHCAVDTAGNTDGLQYYAPEYYNACSIVADLVVSVPKNNVTYQHAHTGFAYSGYHLYYDYTSPYPTGVSANWRDYAQGHLHKPLQADKSYCITFWVVLAETSGYAHDHIGVYVDNGNINKRSPAGDMITDVIPQVYSKHIIKDTMNWTKIDGSFTATGNETHITLGNFAKQEDVDTTSDLGYYAFLNQFSYYLIDDISVVESDLPADAGKDNWVAVAKTVQVGRVGDTTAEAIDCKWYHKGSLIDSGAIITVKANAVAGTIDTYVVVQTVCGLVKSDTALIKTVGLGMQETDFENAFAVYPNPAKGFVYIHSATEINGPVAATIYDLSGRVLFSRQIAFDNKQASLNPNLPGGTYFLAITDEAGRVERARVVMLE